MTSDSKAKGVDPRRTVSTTMSTRRSSLIQTSWSDLTDEDSLDVFLPSLSKTALVAPSALPPVDLDLSGRIKVVVVVGRGGNGKSVFFRVVSEQAIEANGRDTILAAGDLGNRSSKQYYEFIEEPVGNGVAATADLLVRIIKSAAKHKWNALVDLGAGGELAILHLKGPRLLAACESLGVELVVLHVMTASVDNVSVFATLDHEGFRPRASALIFNEAGVAEDTPREVAFELINKQASIRAAKQRGVPQLWFPSLVRNIVNEVEGRRLLFGDAAAGKPSLNKHLGPIDVFEQLAVADWLAQVWFELSPIKSWLSDVQSVG